MDSVFFFFQAEDGIRDRDVTGVQTCALPISAFREGVFNVTSIMSGTGYASTDYQAWGAFPSVLRSEERRVGKECRSGWSPYH